MAYIDRKLEILEREQIRLKRMYKDLHDKVKVVEKHEDKSQRKPKWKNRRLKQPDRKWELKKKKEPGTEDASIKRQKKNKNKQTNKKTRICS